ncbi:MAG: prepilin-type N-terminal cleavage/methylation domain-containing protein [Candidatus Omnitrophica bacterium]|jgi:prepilin-type N-terminal cleavage/methylation domain-containing protein|nr:prepilin-type N-terminal cleavage/methylation domain-containing protein [Candidatus Omnitrophota bacterium]
MLIKKGFTLVELIIVALIIGTLAAIGMPAYTKAKERTLDKEAKATLSLIQAAEKIYKMEAGHFYPPSGTDIIISNINTYLRVNLPSSGTNWNILLNSNTNTLTAARVPVGGVGPARRSWSVTYTADINTATCTPGGSDPCL